VCDQRFRVRRAREDAGWDSFLVVPLPEIDNSYSVPLPSTWRCDCGMVNHVFDTCVFCGLVDPDEGEYIEADTDDDEAF
jgi:hypothetical protein